ncbi:MAG: hypothetical protein ACSHWW_10885 [Nonlabens sp.]|uniref:hypothetical protein n=1 Tax=Nonlabens sp. TaxID=1888209 RepID=UPI003EF271AA
MNHNAQLNAVLIFEYAFNLLEAEMNRGSKSIGAREKILEVINALPEKLENPTIEKLLSQVPIIKSNDKLMATQFIPATMIISFCNELALKALIHQTNGVNQRGHKLSDLISHLSEIERIGIKQEMTSELNISDSEYDSLLNTNDDGFIKWRYFYEGGPSANLLFLKSMFKAVKKRITWD